MQDGRDAAEVLAALKTEVAKLQDDPIVLTVSGPELMAVAEDCGAVNGMLTPKVIAYKNEHA